MDGYPWEESEGEAISMSIRNGAAFGTILGAAIESAFRRDSWTSTR